MFRRTCSAVLWSALALAGSAAAQPDDLYQGDAYGSYAFVDGTVVAGRTAPVGLGCVTAPGIHNENGVAGFDLSPILTTGVLNTTADSIEDLGVSTSLVTAEVNDLALLDAAGPAPPLISATQVRSVSSTSFDGLDFSVDGSESFFLDLTVLGLPVIDPAPNTEIALPGIGKVVLNEQASGIQAAGAFLDVNMIHVYVEDELNIFGLPLGTEIIVAHARSALRPGAAVAVLGGQAYVTSASVGELALLGPTARVSLGCLGGDSSNNIAGVSLPPLFDLGQGETTAVGSVGSQNAVGETTASVEAVDLLDGLITADAVVAVAQGMSDGQTAQFSDAGSLLVNLVVDGQAIVDVDPNTQIPLPGIGTLWLHRVISTHSSFEVRMIELVIEEPGIPGVDVGTEVQVAVANLRFR